MRMNAAIPIENIVNKNNNNVRGWKLSVYVSLCGGSLIENICVAAYLTNRNVL